MKKQIPSTRLPEHFCAVPIVLRNRAGELALLIQDNAPIWRMLGNGFNPQDNEQKQDLYYRNLQRILKQETNLPVSLREKAKPLYRFSIRNAQTNDRMEANRVFAIDVGDFPVQSKKGAFLEFFAPDKRPKNMLYLHDQIFDIAAKVLKQKPQNEKRLTLFHDGTLRMQALLDMIRQGETITGLEKWRKTPSVAQKREANTLLCDPMPQ